MTAEETRRRRSLASVRAQVEALLHADALAQAVHEAGTPGIAAPELDAALRGLVDALHPADFADLLETLPSEDRLVVWRASTGKRDGQVLLEVDDAVRAGLVADMDDVELLAAAAGLDPDEVADLIGELPAARGRRLLVGLTPEQRVRVQSALAWDEDQVGALMDFEMVTLREDVSLAVVLRYLRRFDALPSQTDKLFVVNDDGVLTGVLPLGRLLVHGPATSVREVMLTDVNTFQPEDDADQAAQAFERYDLVSAPVVDGAGRLVGRLTVDEIVDRIRAQSESARLSRAGLSGTEDIFAPVTRSVRNRWAWLAINLVTAFIASRVIGVFEGSIERLVALATLMPIVAGIGGNAGNQTITMIVRAMALDRLGARATRRLLRKELGVAVINGLLWGGVIGVVAGAIYASVPLGAVMTAAMTLNLLLAALMGVLIPTTMRRLGRDPALGSSVMITFVTDSGGFFIFLGLATLFLV
ncbi:magnesium transporter [Coralloluteibacterium thermophilus]|uniref:Magnesium transporter MgtE n=1 Tax=Coralloluteibacterium thermophilum TaxID=2707049 RepID=A0ABV9NM53_9GAMM